MAGMLRRCRDQEGGSPALSRFRAVLEQVTTHPNREYFVLKSIIVNNLYGLDLMEEAVEICKLRLFLKLAAQIEPDPTLPNMGAEPLPDIDFNVFAGNALVGYASYDEVRRVVGETVLGQGRLQFGQTPASSMYAVILTEIDRALKRGEQPRFVKQGRGMVTLAVWEPVGLPAEIEQHNRRVRQHLHERLHTMGPAEFESLIGRLLTAIGFENVSVTAAS